MPNQPTTKCSAPLFHDYLLLQFYPKSPLSSSSVSPMASVPRKLLSTTLTITITKPPCPLLACFNFCDCVKPPPLPSDVPLSPEHRLIPTSITIMACFLGVFFITGIVFAAARLYYLRRIQTRTPNPPILFHTHDDFADEDLAGGHPHPIWLINFVGLTQPVIDSITVCKYRSGEGLIEGTECSVCLSEFEEDESLRLLPKCNHAFHLPCIDTWLTNHQNCPLCRAPIVSAAAAAAPEAAAADSETQPESARTEIDVIGDDPIGRNGDSRALSDLSDERRVGLEVMRRSVSMDASWASMADLGGKRLSNSRSFKRSGTRFYGLVKSASFVQKKRVSMKMMKRSCSSQNCRSRSQDSIFSL